MDGIEKKGDKRLQRSVKTEYRAVVPGREEWSFSEDSIYTARNRRQLQLDHGFSKAKLQERKVTVIYGEWEDVNDEGA